MQLPKIAAVLSLFGALGIGLAAVYIADSRREVTAVDGPTEITSTLATQTPFNPESLAGGQERQDEKHAQLLRLSEKEWGEDRHFRNG